MDYAELTTIPCVERGPSAHYYHRQASVGCELGDAARKLHLGHWNTRTLT